MAELCRSNVGNAGYGNNQIFINYGNIRSNQAGNYSTISIEYWFYAPVYITFSSGNWSLSGATSQSGGFSGRKEGGNTLIWAGDVVVYHDNQGNGRLSLTGNIHTTYVVNGSCSGSVDLPQIPRQAVMTSANDFNDEQTPYFTFNNLGSYSINAYLEFGNGSMIYRGNISSTGSYSFDLSEEERKLLRSKCSNSNTLPVRYVLQTNINGNIYYSYLDRTMNIINARPIFEEFIFEDTNINTVGMTIDNQKLISGKSDLQVTIPIANKMVTVKESTPIKYRLNVGDKSVEANYSDNSDVLLKINNVTNGNITVTAIDSRGNNKPILKTALIVPYNIPIINELLTIRKNGIDTIVNVEMNGTYDNTDFGKQNVITKIEWKNSNSETYIDITSSFNILDGKFSNKDNLELTGFDLGNTYTLNFKITDGNSKFYLSEILKDSVVDNGEPPFDLNLDKSILALGKIGNNSLPKGSIDAKGDIYSRGYKVRIEDKYDWITPISENLIFYGKHQMVKNSWRDIASFYGIVNGFIPLKPGYKRWFKMKAWINDNITNQVGAVVALFDHLGSWVGPSFYFGATYGSGTDNFGNYYYSTEFFVYEQVNTGWNYVKSIITNDSVGTQGYLFSLSLVEYQVPDGINPNSL